MKEIKFKRDTSFRKQFIVPNSFSHPAKMDSQLLIWIVENFTDKGETILDPMAGSGTTMLACTLGRNCVLVELEEKFCKMMQDNWEQVRMRPQLGCEMGGCEIIQGDARQLDGVVDKIVTSPPFNEGGNQPPSDKHVVNEFKKTGKWLAGLRYSDNPENIGNLPYGQIDKIVTSPPYTNRMDGGNRGDDAGMKPYTDEPRDTWFTQRDQQNIGNLPYGQIDKIVTSPPYAETGVGDWQTGRAEFQEWVLNELASKGYVEWQGKQYSETEWRAMNHGRIDGRTTKGVHKHPTDGYGSEEGQIGNLKSTSYLEAMLQVYKECYKVLKNGGLMILVTKNFIRRKKVIRLDLDTISLCEQAGFVFRGRYYRKLPAQSFWRIIYYQKNPEVEKLDYEDVLIFERM